MQLILDFFFKISIRMYKVYTPYGYVYVFVNYSTQGSSTEKSRAQLKMFTCLFGTFLEVETTVELVKCFSARRERRRH